MHDDERVEHPEPERVPTAHAVALGQAGEGVCEDADGEQRGDPHGDRRGIRVVGEDTDDEVLHLERERAVRRGRVDPHRVDLVGERARHPERPDGVRVHPAQDDLALRAHQQLDVGAVLINQIPMFRVENMPYGGIKDSGFGREGIRYAMEEMTEIKSLIIRQ